MVSLLSRDDGRVSDQREMNPGVWHQIGLELVEVNIKSTIKTERGSNGGDNLTNQTIQVGVGWPLNIQITTADIVQSLVVDLVGHIGVLQQGVDTQHGVVGLDNGGRDLGAAPDGEGDLGLLTVIDGQSFHHEGTQTGSGTTTDGVVDQEALETGTVVGKLSETIQAQVDDLLTDGVVTTGEVVRGILLTRDQLFRVEELTVGTGSDLIDNGGLQIDEDGTGNVLSGTSFGEKGVESVIATTDGLVGRHLPIRLDTVFQTEQLPACVTDLDTGLTDVDADGFSHFVDLFFVIISRF